MKKTKKEKNTEIYVSLVFEGKQDSRQLFIGLMIDKAKHKQNTNGIKSDLEHQASSRYNGEKVFSGVRVG